MDFRIKLRNLFKDEWTYDRLSRQEKLDFRIKI